MRRVGETRDLSTAPGGKREDLECTATRRNWDEDNSQFRFHESNREATQ